MQHERRKRGRPKADVTKDESLSLRLRAEDRQTFDEVGGTRWLEERLAEERARRGNQKNG